jgi:hypothetical protein
MYQRKTPVSQLPDKNEFTTYNPHSIDLSKRDWPEVVKVVSIDPGIRNLALRVESRGIRSSSYPIKTIVFEKLHIAEDDRRLDGNVDQLFTLVTDFLDKYLSIFKESHMLIIERQLPINYKAVRVSQHIVSYFLFHFKNIMPSLPVIYEVDPKLKGRELGASKHLNERGIKQWSVDHAKILLAKRKDYGGLAVLNKNKKKSDDHADCLNQVESFFSFNGWPLTSDVLSLPVKPIIETKSLPLSKLNLQTEKQNPQNNLKTQSEAHPTNKPETKILLPQLTLQTTVQKPQLKLKIVSN